MSKIEIIRKPTEEDWARCYRLALGTEGKGTDATVRGVRSIIRKPRVP